MQDLNKLLNDKEIINFYSLTNENKNYYVEHNLNHALRVVNICKSLATKLNFNSIDIDNICVAALLHDIGAGKLGKIGHAKRSFKIAQNYTSNKKILDAIKHHSNGCKSDYGYILTLADKLDICRNRVTDLGKTILGVGQWVHLISMNFEISNGLLLIKFKSDKKLDIKELNEYYFTKKIFNAIKKFANYFDLKYQVYIDTYRWF